ncbi:G-box-binding factor 4-like isoform X1 [Humulus lupulus]|uniref:G-box-binding factor 4-like isoform X1 n=1 Tax=Humulus lupulus TaxID=3486 RepID=UPI002B4066E1|nr:G-box-binding factor 4-like isoform X1 [Humulus lupulus]
MALSNVVIASASATNSELPRQSSICSPNTIMSEEDSRNIASMDDLLKNIPNIFPEQPQQQQQQNSHPLASFPVAGVGESWSGAVASGSDWKTDSGEIGSAMTLEDYLTHSEAVRDEDIRAQLGYGQFHMPLQLQAVENPVVVCGNGSGTSGRGKRQAVDPPVDKATAQKQRRMIKNRESAARSRERKQAYQVELETLVTELEDEKARLLREEVERTQERFRQLMKNVIPVEEKKKTPRVLRRVRSL